MNGAEESVARTMLVAVGVALFCSAMVTTAVFLLRPIQAAYQAIERNRAIVVAAGVVAPGAADEAVVDAFLDLEALVIDRMTGERVEGLDPRTFDHWQVMPEPDQARPLHVPVYIRREQGRIVRVVFPVDGQGMWSTIYGYLALEPELNTVAALVIHEHGETPGIGDRIQSPNWLAGWIGKQVRDAEGGLRIDVTADAALAPEHRVDVITGATITSQAVGRMVRDWFGEDGYQSALPRLAAAIEDEGGR
jgi:Na+-transporting NADH:ubiquinone oxidoreductase subunit C